MARHGQPEALLVRDRAAELCLAAGLQYEATGAGEKVEHTSIIPMTIEQVIKKAIEGGYNFSGEWHLKGVSENGKLAWGTAFGGDDASAEDVQEWELPTDTIFLDPSFWQSLGKALGWKNQDYPTIRRCALSREGVEWLKNQWSLRNKTTGRIVGESRDKQNWWVQWDGDKAKSSYHKSFIYLFPDGDWNDKWHRFIDHLADGKTAEDFFESLI